MEKVKRNLGPAILILVLAGILGGLIYSAAQYQVGQVEDTRETAAAEPSAPPAPVGSIESTGTKEGPSEVKEFAVVGTNFKFDVSEIRVKKGDKVRIVFKNAEGFHDWKVDEFKAATKQIKANEQDMVEFTADKTGTFEYYCSVGEHRAMGMKGNLIVE